MSEQPIGCNHQGEDDCYGQCVLNALPERLLPDSDYRLVATNGDAYGLYHGPSNHYAIRTRGGETDQWEYITPAGYRRPKDPPMGGRWRWLAN